MNRRFFLSREASPARGLGFLQSICKPTSKTGFNNRANPFLFRDTIMCLLDAPVLEYKKITSEAA